MRENVNLYCPVLVLVFLICKKELTDMRLKRNLVYEHACVNRCSLCHTIKEIGLVLIRFWGQYITEISVFQYLYKTFWYNYLALHLVLHLQSHLLFYRLKKNWSNFKYFMPLVGRIIFHYIAKNRQLN